MSVKIEDLGLAGESRRRAYGGMRWSLARMDAAIESQMTDRMYVSAIETAMWACALDGLIETHLGSEAYRPRRDADPDGSVLRGLRWVRNESVHGLVSIHKQTRGSTDFSMPPVDPDGLILTWLPAAGPPKKKGHIILYEAYEQSLSGKPVLDTLQAAFRFLSDPARTGEEQTSLQARNRGWRTG